LEKRASRKTSSLYWGFTGYAVSVTMIVVQVGRMIAPGNG